MRKTVFIIIPLLFLCSPGFAKKKVAKQGINIIRQKPDPRPSWVTQARFKLVKEEGKEYIYFTLTNRSLTLQHLRSMIEADKAKHLAQLIGQFTSKEVFLVDTGLRNAEGKLKDVYLTIVTSISRNVDTSGAIPIRSYWRYIQEVKGTKSSYYYEMSRQYKMEYKVLYDRLMKQFELHEPQFNKELHQGRDIFLKKIRKHFSSL